MSQGAALLRLSRWFPRYLDNATRRIARRFCEDGPRSFGDILSTETQ